MIRVRMMHSMQIISGTHPGTASHPGTPLAPPALIAGDPSASRAARQAWFTRAGYGMFIHYGLYSLLGRGEWAQYHERIPHADYERLASDFAPSAFDADRITDLACEAGMGYVTCTACHHDGFCLWDSATEPFNSVQACGRDLVRELAEQCARKQLGFFAYHTHVLNWRHPWAMTRAMNSMARPDYAQPAERYRLTDPGEVARFWQWSHATLDELARMDAPLAGLWLDIISTWYTTPELVPIDETYRRIRAARPEALIAYKQGANGAEDFAAPEFNPRSLGAVFRDRGDPAAAARADRAWALTSTKPKEICMTLQDRGWGYVHEAKHKDADALWASLAHARSTGCNLLANVGPLADGSLHPEDVASLRAVGRRLRSEGWPVATPAAETIAPVAGGAAGE